MPNFVTNLSWILLFLAILVWMARAILRTTRALHIFQLEGYKTVRFLKWLANNPKRMFEIREVIILGCFFILVLIGYATRYSTILPFLLLFWIAIEIYFIVKRNSVKAKKPLVYTARAKRLFGLSIVLLFSFFAGVMLLGRELSVPDSRDGFAHWQLTGNQFYYQFLILFIFTFVFNQLAAINLTISNVLIYPLERTINESYLMSARNRIKKLHPKVIAITGSYGKTSTKYILNTILSQKFSVLMTPDSYNTPMGICKVIRGQLEPEHEIFIVEMGAYKRGEIRDLCKLVYPEIGILTAIGAQHLERFKSIDNIASTKYELIESLPQNGIAVFNDDNEICSSLADKTKIKVVRYGIDRNVIASPVEARPEYQGRKKKSDEEAKLTARNIRSTNEGLTFTVEYGSGEMEQFKTKLLGRSNVYNILAATAVALECGITLNEVSRATKSLEPIPHRLQLIPGAGGVTVIDDGFNANPVGARAALEVLGSFAQGRKILVTPGLVELGEIEFEQNKIFGTEAAKVSDFVILVGPKRTESILEGLRTSGFPEGNITVVESLATATERLQQIVKTGDVVLFENDLPDTYDEG